MITLITGTPGAGKTAYTIGEMLKMGIEGRPLFVHGVPDLTLPHEVVICSSKSCAVCPQDEESREGHLKAEEWHDWAPDGGILLFDEVQHIYRPRSSGSKPPESVQAFETHRHRGLDFWMVTQMPRLLDTHVRSLSGKHIHLKATWAKRHQFEWPECKDTPQSTGDAIQSTYKLDKKVFPLYQSASVHTKISRKIPKQLFVLPLLILLGSAMGFKVYSSLYGDRTLPASSSQSVAVAEGANASPATATEIFSPLDFTPADPNVPESAPAYLHLVEAKTFPQKLACMMKEASGDCVCYTQQATIYQTDYKSCYEQVTGKYFNPYIEEKQPNEFSNTNYAGKPLNI